MKPRAICVTSIILVIVVALSGCTPIVEEPPRTTTIYATFYPIYALAQRIIRDVPNVEMHCLVQPQDECLRDYQLSDWDLYLLNYSADAVLAGGNGLESFAGKLEQLSEHNLALAEVLYGIDLYQRKDADDEDNHFSGANPHCYLSIDGALQLLESICVSLSVIDSRNAAAYDINLQTSIAEINELKADIYEQTLVCSGAKVILMNEALIYPAQDYGLNVVEWIERESAEMLYDSALEDCIARIRESGADIVLVEQQAPLKLIETLENRGFTVAKMNVLSTLSENDGFEGYLDAMLENASAVREAYLKSLE